MGLEWILRMSRRACSLGSSMSRTEKGKSDYVWSKKHNFVELTRIILRILRSSLPGRRRAGSRVSGLLVAMIILTLWRVSKPSIWFSSWYDTNMTHFISHLSCKSAIHTDVVSWTSPRQSFKRWCREQSDWLCSHKTLLWLCLEKEEQLKSGKILVQCTLNAQVKHSKWNLSKT